MEYLMWITLDGAGIICCKILIKHMLSRVVKNFTYAQRVRINNMKRVRIIKEHGVYKVQEYTGDWLCFKGTWITRSDPFKPVAGTIGPLNVTYDADKIFKTIEEAEAFQLCEYGSQPDAASFGRIFGGM